MIFKELITKVEYDDVWKEHFRDVQISTSIKFVVNKKDVWLPLTLIFQI